MLLTALKLFNYTAPAFPLFYTFFIGIDYSAISFTDNQLVLDLISKRPNGLFHQISNASLFGKLTDEKLLNNITTKLKKKKDKNGTPNANSHFVGGGFRDRMLFTGK